MSSKARKPKVPSKPPSAPHPGPFVREQCLAPRKLSVVAAAKLVGVGRPALSNFLNGNAAATPEMAARIEVAFGIPQEELLAMQAAHDASETKNKGTPADAVPYAAPFLKLTARDIEHWADRITARQRLSVFLRILINSTNRKIKNIDFPGNDDSERPGWDGYLETDQGTPWIPEGASGWEFGTNKDPKTKADSDYAKSLKLPASERKNLTFVFVTPRPWPKKSQWIASQRAKKQWRDVRAYDSSDLEQWLELSIPAQAWFAHETSKNTRGVKTLAQCWQEWASVTSQQIPAALFTPAIEAAKGTLYKLLAQKPNTPISIMADSSGEALAFLAQFFEATDNLEMARVRDRVLIFEDPDTAKELAMSTASFIAVTYKQDVEKELAPYMQSRQCINIYPRNAANVEPTIVLEPLGSGEFHKVLDAAGYSRDEINRLEQESGRSITILRRRLANTAAIQTPAWASAPATARALVPFLWIGAWSATSTPDKGVLKLLANTDSYEDIERTCLQFTEIEDPPTWAVGNYRGVTSKLDLLFAIKNQITRSDLEQFFQAAEIILGEDDPSLDLPEEKRWAANIYGKSREFSGGLRQGISETLVLLSVYGRELFWDRLGFDCDAAARDLVRELLTPLKTRTLEAQDPNLTAYAEAAPEEFLRIIEEDLASPHPETYGLMRPVKVDILGAGCPRTGLLWALESLAWNPNTMPRVAMVLAQLSKIEIDDNWMNRPINSLKGIFRSWMPQTAASLEVRIGVVKLIAQRFPEVAWEICLAQLENGQIGEYNHKPKWRNDGHGHGEPLKTDRLAHAFTKEMAELVLNWKQPYTQSHVSDFITHLTKLSPAHQEKAFGIISDWSTNASDREKSCVREQIRRNLLTRRGRRARQNGNGASIAQAAGKLYAALEPEDLLYKNEWLFRQHWVEESADELDSDDFDFKRRDENIANLRTSALQEIFASRGPAGIIELSDLGNAPYVIGYLLSERLLDLNQLVETIGVALASPEDTKEASRRALISGLVNGIGSEDTRAELHERLKGTISEADYVRVLLAAPFQQHTWRRVDQLGSDAQELYWRTVYPEWSLKSEAEISDAIERLIAAKRPRAAFHSAHHELEKVDPDLLYRLMLEIVQETSEPKGSFLLSPYNIEKAFAHIDSSTTLTLEQKATLEYLYLDALAKSAVREEKHGLANLEQYMALHPELYVQCIAYAYKRDDEGIDPPEFSASSDQVQYHAERAYKLIDAIETLPGCDKHNALDEKKIGEWINTVREACSKLGRLKVADLCIGEMIAHTPADPDGVWPCGVIRNILEELHSSTVMRGARIGRFNSQGARWRGEGGALELALANQYRGWAESVQYTHPYVASELLMEMARWYEHDARREDTDAKIKRRLH